MKTGKPAENAFIEVFNGRLRDECLNAHKLSLEDAGERARATNQTRISVDQTRRRQRALSGFGFSEWLRKDNFEARLENHPALPL